jgi:hypothetical protein
MNMSQEIEICSASKSFEVGTRIELGEVEADTIIDIKVTMYRGYASLTILLDNERLASINIREGETIPLKRIVPRKGRVLIDIADIGGLLDPRASGKISVSCKKIIKEAGEKKEQKGREISRTEIKSERFYVEE